MHRHRRRLEIRLDTLRQLTRTELSAAGGRPTALLSACGCAARAGTTSEAEGGGPCPGEYSWTCKP